MSENKLVIESIKVNFKFLEYTDLKAIFSLDFGDFVIRGWRISKSKYKKIESENDESTDLWIVPPSYQEKGGKYHPMFFIPNKELWEQLEAYILQKYHEASEEQMKKRFEIKEQEIEF